MTNIGIVILNYLSYDVTIKCVDYFKKQNKDNVNVKIIVVDNCSPNESYSKLFSKFKDDDIVTLVKTPKNLGFANGNNYGYKELLNFMDPDFVIMSNSDAYVKDPGLYEWINDSYKKYKFGILGPAIYSVRGKFYQSPIPNFTKNFSEIKKYKIHLQLSVFKAYIKSKLNLKENNEFSVDRWDNPFFKQMHSDMTLHGAFEIFSKDYLVKYKLPYDMHSFMYMEEYILRLRCEKINLPMIYSPEYKTYHLQAVSTNKSAKSESQRVLFKRKNMLRSLDAYVKFLKNNL